MEAILKKEYVLEGLYCAVCADKIEAEIRALDGVSEAVVDFPSQKLSMRIGDKSKLACIAAQADKIVRRYEPDVVMSELASKPSKTEPKTDRKERAYRMAMIVGAAIFVIGMVFDFTKPVEFTLFFVSYLLVGGEVVWRALKNISAGQVFDENFLMSAATLGAFAIGEYPEGVAVMLFYQIGEAFQEQAVKRSRKSIEALMDIRPDFANVKIGDEIKRVSPDEVRIGNLIVVKPGEKIPLDGIVNDGYSALDTSALTGESMPRDVGPSSEVLSGSINKSGLLTIEVTKEFGESTVSKILDLVQNASGKKSQVENFITKFARYYTPAVVFAALALAVIPPLAVQDANFMEWIDRALVFLVVSCPCALVISIPLGFFGGIGGASRRGILVKGSNFLEALNDVDTVVFDKTGTLTKGTFNVARIEPASGFTSDSLLRAAAYAESASNHPIAVSITKAFGKDIDKSKITEYKEIAGNGVRVTVEGRRVLAGNGKLLDSEGVVYAKPDAIGTAVYIAVDGSFAGYIVIADEVKPDSAAAVKRLKEVGVKRIVMLTGDSRSVGERIGQTLGLDAVYSELLPHQKVEWLEELEKDKASKGKIVFVGDGINDAPVLARSDIGIAMGGVGSDAAIEAADVVLMTDEPSKIVSAILIAKKTRGIVWQNIVLALSVKAVILVLGALGIATMWAAVFGDVGVTVIAILNAMRAMSPTQADLAL
jgi:Cd2+/Zn2+-exporting ATPase